MLVEQQVTPNTLFGDTLMLDDANELLSEMSVQAMPAQVIPAPVISTPVIPEPVKDPWAPNWRTPCNVYGDKNCGLRIYGKHPHLSQDRLHFAAHHAKLFWNFIRHPSEIPGDNIYEKAYAVGVLPVVIPCVVLGGSYVKISRVLRYITKKSTSNHDSWEISRFDKDKEESDFIKARKELGRSLFANGMSSSDEATSLENKFNYYVASYMACFCSVAYSAADKPEFIKESGDNFEQSVLRSALKRPPNADDEPRGLGYKIVYNDGDILLAFKGTTFDFIQDLLSDAAFFRHSNNDEVCKEDKGKGDGAAGKCDTICYRHSYDNRKCSERCIQGCATHAKYLDGEVHQGFYDLLFRPLPNPPSEHLYLTEGPVNAMAVIMEMVLYQVLNADRGRHVSNLWLTGHSLGGALASLVMARLQTTVEDHDPLVRGFDVEDRKRFTGSTVLYVMASQAIANFPAAYACQNCKDEKCKTKDWKNCHDCSNCTMLRSRERRRITWTSMCNSCNVRWEALWTDACQGCKNFMDGEPDLKNTDPTTADPYACQKIGAENCFCGDCGQCDDCKDMTDCQRCNRRRKYWPWILLRDCYTYGSPKVGDTEFARAFDQNKRKSFERIVADRMAAREGGQELTPDEMGSITSRHLYSWPAYWRIANTFDPVTKLPFGRDAYTEKEADDRADDSNNRGSLLDYQHVGYLVQLPSDSSQLPLILPPAVRRRAKGMELYDRFEKYERDRIKGSIQSKDATLNQNQLKETRRLLDKLWTPFKCLLNLSSHYIRNYSDGLLSAEEHFTTYSDKIVTESTGVLLRRFIFDTIGWILGLSSPDESSDRSSDAHKSYGDCDESRLLLGDTEP